jgi:hypothetical protein
LLQEVVMPESKKQDEDEAKRLKRKADEELDRQLEDTFPASDPLKVTRSSYDRQQTSPAKGKPKKPAK